MQTNDIRENLEELHLTLLQASPTTKELQDRSDILAAKIRKTLDSEDLDGFHLSLNDNLDEDVIAFDQKHPNVSELMRRLISLLSASGI